MAWQPADFTADIAAITTAVEGGIPDRATAQNDLAVVEQELLRATAKNPQLEVVVVLSAALSVGFGPFGNGARRGVFIDDVLDRKGAAESPEFWTAYAALPALVTEIRAEVERRRTARR